MKEEPARLVLLCTMALECGAGLAGFIGTVQGQPFLQPIPQDALLLLVSDKMSPKFTSMNLIGKGIFFSGAVGNVRHKGIHVYSYIPMYKNCQKLQILGSANGSHHLNDLAYSVPLRADLT